MPKLVSYDNSGVEESQGGTGVKVKPGVHVARIMICEQREEKNDGTPANDIRLALNVGDEFDWVFTYIGLSDAAKWKMAEFTRALGLKEKGNFDPAKQVGKLIRIKINPDTYEGEYSPRAGRMMKAQKGDEDLLGESVGEAASADGAGPDDDDEPTAEKTYENPDFVASREGEEDVGSYEDWADEDLLAEVEDRGLTLPGGRGSKRNKAIAALRDEDNEVAGADEEPEDEAPSDEYEDWDVDQLKEEWNTREMGDLPSIRGRNAETRMKNSIIEALREDDETNPFEA